MKFITKLMQKGFINLFGLPLKVRALMQQEMSKKMAKLWGGRFSKTTDEMINEFQASIDLDKRMYYEDIKGSIAFIATMLKKCNIITEKDHKDIVNGLTAILNDIESGNFSFDIALEDIHMNIEKTVNRTNWSCRW